VSKFSTELLLRALSAAEVKAAESDRQLYVLASELRYESDLFGEIVVPAGFVTDFASIPRAALWYVDDDDPAILFASVVHDYLYTKKGDLGRGTNLILSRQNADEVLREAMLVSGARKAQAFVVYSAVRLGGGSHWK
jgi:hypothetical protein